MQSLLEFLVVIPIGTCIRSPRVETFKNNWKVSRASIRDSAGTRYKATVKNTALFALCARGHSRYPAVEISKVGVPGQREEAQVQRCAASPSPWRASSRFKHEGCVFAGLAGVASHRVATRRAYTASERRQRSAAEKSGGGREGVGGGDPSRGVAVQETFRAARRAPLRRRSSR